jgi:hypothetical protein
MYRRKIENTIATVLEVLESAGITHRPYTSSISLKTSVLVIKFPIKDRFLPDELDALDAVVRILKARGIDSKITKAQSYSSDYNVLVYINMSGGTCSTCSYWDEDSKCLCSDVVGDIYAQMQGDHFGIAARVDDDSGLTVSFKTGPDFGCVKYKAKK